jgi:hypothetical protein
MRADSTRLAFLVHAGLPERLPKREGFTPRVLVLLSGRKGLLLKPKHQVLLPPKLVSQAASPEVHLSPALTSEA